MDRIRLIIKQVSTIPVKDATAHNEYRTIDIDIIPELAKSISDLIFSSGYGFGSIEGAEFIPEGGRR